MVAGRGRGKRSEEASSCCWPALRLPEEVGKDPPDEWEPGKELQSGGPSGSRSWPAARRASSFPYMTAQQAGTPRLAAAAARDSSALCPGLAGPRRGRERAAGSRRPCWSGCQARPALLRRGLASLCRERRRRGSARRPQCAFCVRWVALIGLLLESRAMDALPSSGRCAGRREGSSAARPGGVWGPRRRRQPRPGFILERLADLALFLALVSMQNPGRSAVGAVLAHGSLELLGSSDPPASASQVAGAKDIGHHTQDSEDKGMGSDFEDSEDMEGDPEEREMGCNPQDTHKREGHLELEMAPNPQDSRHDTCT
ncbi:Zinc finger protein 697, partial [Plecturocebus cupreus]